MAATYTYTLCYALTSYHTPQPHSKLPDGSTRPSFDKGVEYDGPIAPGKRARDLTIYNTYNGMTN